ncbi:hypothetical protein [Sinorhizobium meliloti]|uniref:hypothetical protein n=1 Tax=Rhizobium meliloti TaxID=382 RepID=UPI003D65FA23
MTDYSQSNWAELDADNDGVAPLGVQGGYAPSAIAPIIRAIMGAAKRNYNRSNAIYTTTGTGNAYILTWEGAPLAYVKGEKLAFFADRANTGAATLNINGLGAKAIVMPDGSALTASQIKAGRILEVAYNGTSFVLLGFVDQNLKLGDVSANTLVLTTALGIPEGGTGATTVTNARTNLGLAAVANTASASDLTTGTLADARLPSTMAGKTFTSNVAITGASNFSITGPSNGIEVGALGVVNTPFIDFHTGATSVDYDVRLIASGGNGTNGGGTLAVAAGSFTFNGGTIWCSVNDGAGSGLDSDLLDGQHGSYYTNATNLLSGTVPNARISGAYDGITTLGQTGLHTITTDAEAIRLVGTATGDPYITFYKGATRQAYIQHTDGTGVNQGLMFLNDVATGGDTRLTLLNSGGVNGLEYTVNGVEYKVWNSGNDGAGSGLDADTVDGIQGSSIVQHNGGQWNIYAYPRKSDGSNITFHWSGQSGQPTWLWGSNDGVNMYVYNPSNFNVNYATSAGNANTLDGINSTGFAQVYAGSDSNYASFPVGSIVGVHVGSFYTRNTLAAIHIYTAQVYSFVSANYGSGLGTQLAGTWRARGVTAGNDEIQLFQRTA